MKNFLSLSFILIILVLFFNKTLFFNQIHITGDFLRSDILHQNLPFKYLLYQSWRAGKIPFWTKDIFAGYPIFAEGQMGFFYPVYFLPALIFPFFTAYNLSLFLTFFLGGVGMFFLGRSFGLSRKASTFSAFAYCLSGIFVLNISHHGRLSVSSLLPFSFLFFKRYFEKRRWGDFLLSSLIIALEVFAGYFQLTFYSLFLFLIFFLFYQKQLKISRWRLIFDYFLMIIFGFLVSAVQILPTLELVFQSVREKGLTYIILEGLPYHPRNLITFIFPYIFGDPGKGTYPRFGQSWGMFWENTAYVGLITLVLAIFSIKFLTKKNLIKKVTITNKIVIKDFWLLFFFSLFLALGKYGPFFWIYYLPGFNLFRVTARFLVFSVFSLAILAGFGFEFFILKIKWARGRWFASFFLILILLIDLFIFAYYYNPTVLSEKVLAKPPAVEFLKKMPKTRVFSVASFLTYDQINKNGWRENITANLNHRNALDPNINFLWQIENIEGYPALFLKRQEAFRGLIYQDLRIEGKKIVVGKSAVKLLSLANVGYLISSFNLVGEGLEKLTEVGSGIKYQIYQNKNFLPKGVFYSSYQPANQSVVFEKLTENDFDPKNQVFLEAWLINRQGVGLGKKGEEKVKLEEEKDGYYLFKINTQSPKIFFLSESFYPGWTAYVNQKETPIYPASGMFMAIQVPAGQSVVEFVYQPVSFYLGGLVSGLTVLVLLGGIFWRSFLTTAVEK